MIVLFAITTIVASMLALFLGTWNRELHSKVDEALDARDLAREAEYRAKSELADFRFDLETSEPPVATAPPSHDVEAIDMDRIISESDDPVWSLVSDNYDLMARWEDKNPHVKVSQAHVRYSEFATFVLNLPVGDQNRDGIAIAIACLDTVPS